MYGTQCNDIISNIVFIRMFFTLFSNKMISFLPFSVNCLQVVMFQIMPALCPHGQGNILLDDPLIRDNSGEKS